MPMHQVKEAREKEIRLMTENGTFEIVPESTVIAAWLGDFGKSGARSRLVANEFNTFKRDHVVPNTPYLSVARLLVSKAATSAKPKA